MAADLEAASIQLGRSACGSPAPPSSIAYRASIDTLRHIDSDAGLEHLPSCPPRAKHCHAPSEHVPIVITLTVQPSSLKGGRRSSCGGLSNSGGLAGNGFFALMNLTPFEADAAVRFFAACKPASVQPGFAPAGRTSDSFFAPSPLSPFPRLSSRATTTLARWIVGKHKTHAVRPV